MIEKELNMPIYDLIKETRGTFLASYYTGMGTMFSYDLTEGYIEGKDELMDIVLRDFDVSHDVDRVIKKIRAGSIADDTQSLINLYLSKPISKYFWLEV